ncbi:MAG: MogA/MoaB family molybdenum cofactor biosynthesis protein [Spirochaetaceae bacterium]
MNILIITLSDRASKGEYEDLSGPKIENILQKHYKEDVKITRKLIPDSKILLMDSLNHGNGYDIILTTGGTGLGPRDFTPDVCQSWADKEAPGISEYIRTESIKETKNAILSRGYAGIKGSTLVINFPGSVKAVTLCTNILLDILPHAVSMIAGGKH